MAAGAASPRPPGHRLALGLLAATVAVWAVLLALSLRAAALPDAASGTLLVLFPPSLGEERALAAIVGAGGLPVRRTALGPVWVARGEGGGFVGRLRAAGALAALPDLPFGPGLGGCVVLASPQGRV